MKSLLTGLFNIHEKKIVHRDIKPENIMMGGNPIHNDVVMDSIVDTDYVRDLRIIDFGFSAKTK
jgi:serine/threonine protein kinase